MARGLPWIWVRVQIDDELTMGKCEESVYYNLRTFSLNESPKSGITSAEIMARQVGVLQPKRGSSPRKLSQQNTWLLLLQNHRVLCRT
jgi:hypothetical protein